MRVACAPTPAAAPMPGPRVRKCRRVGQSISMERLWFFPLQLGNVLASTCRVMNCSDFADRVRPEKGDRAFGYRLGLLRRLLAANARKPGWRSSA